jgi:hypothetical protein
MPTLTYSLSVSGGGITIQKSMTRTGSGTIAVQETLPAAKAGTLSTRTDNDTGVATLGASHGITDGMIVDVHWSGGVRYGMTVGTVSGTSVPIDLGSGDNLPAQATAITVVQQTIINVLIDGDELEHLTISLETSDTTLTTAGHVLFEDAAGDDIKELDLVANTPSVYDGAAAVAAFTGDVIVTCKASNANSTTTAELKIVGVYDAVA